MAARVAAGFGPEEEAERLHGQTGGGAHQFNSTLFKVPFRNSVLARRVQKEKRLPGQSLHTELAVAIGDRGEDKTWRDGGGGEEKEGGEERLGDGERGRREGERRDGDEREQQQGPDGAMKGVLDPAAVPGLRREEVGGPANMLRKSMFGRAPGEHVG